MHVDGTSRPLSTFSLHQYKSYCRFLCYHDLTTTLRNENRVQTDPLPLVREGWSRSAWRRPRTRGRRTFWSLKTSSFGQPQGGDSPSSFSSTANWGEGSICHRANGGAREPRRRPPGHGCWEGWALSPSCESHSVGITAIRACRRNTPRETRNL